MAIQRVIGIPHYALKLTLRLRTAMGTMYIAKSMKTENMIL